MSEKRPGAEHGSIWVVIPALNAERELGGVLAGCFEQSFGERVIVVDDGSTDATASIARGHGVIVARHPRNRGKGEALRTGFEVALREGAVAVITMDSDGQHLATEAPKLLETWTATGADLVIGSRSHLFGDMVRRRRFANQFSAATVSWFAGCRVNDSQSGFRLYSREFMTRIDFQSAGFAAESEMVILAGRRGMTIRETPIRLGYVNGVSTSHYRPVLDSLRIAGSVVAASMRPILRTGRLS